MDATVLTTLNEMPKINKAYQEAELRRIKAYTEVTSACAYLLEAVYATCLEMQSETSSALRKLAQQNKWEIPDALLNQLFAQEFPLFTEEGNLVYQQLKAAKSINYVRSIPTGKGFEFCFQIADESSQETIVFFLPSELVMLLSCPASEIKIQTRQIIRTRLQYESYFTEKLRDLRGLLQKEEALRKAFRAKGIHR